jgi:hypothetical protein
MKTVDEIKAAMNAPVTNFVTWKPEIKEVTGGFLKEIKTVYTKHGDRQIIVLENDEGTVDIWMSRVLEDVFENLNVIIGDGLAIRYDGEKEIKNRRPMKKYSVWKLEPESVC